MTGFRRRRLLATGTLLLAIPGGAALAQPCYTGQTLGGAASVTLVTAIEDLGTSKANMNAKEDDGVPAHYYQVSNSSGFTQVLFATEIISDSAADNDRAPFGLIFINPTNNPVTVTRVDLLSDTSLPGLFRMAPPPVGITPVAGWSWVNGWDVRWTGSITLPAHSGLDFLVEAKISNLAVNILNDIVTGTCVTSAGNFTAVGYKTDVYVPSASNKVATGVVAFDNGAYPRGYVTGLVSGVPNTVSIRVQEWAGNAAIQGGMTVRVSIPAGWSNVSVSSAPAPFNGARTIVQPTPTTDGYVLVTTTGAINKGSITARLQITATTPVAYADSVYNMQMRLAGTDASGHPVESVCDGVVQVLPAVPAGIEVAFLSPALSATGVRRMDLEIALSSINGLGTESYSVDVYNFRTAAWENIYSGVPGAPDVTVTATKDGATNVDDYLNASSQARVRITSPGTATSRTLRVDYLSWTVIKGYTVDNLLGNDANNGNGSRPFRTISRGATAVAGSGAVWVDVGASQSGTPYDANVLVTGAGRAGTLACPTLLQGVASGGLLPLVRGVNPNADVGFDVATNYVTVDGFQVANTQVGLGSEPGTTGIRFSSNWVQVPNMGFGLLTYGSAASSVVGNRVDAAAAGTFFGIWDYEGNGNTIDANKVSGQGSDGIVSHYSSGLVVQRNIAKGNLFGIHVSNAVGAVTLYNNTVDQSSWFGIYVEQSPGATTSRNNVVVNGAGYGWAWDGIGSISSNYDDVFANASNYAYTATVTPGAASISANPSFVQTANPALPTYYKLNPASPCIDRGTNVGLPFLGAAPDMGAVETQ